MMDFYFHKRIADDKTPAGLTVSKHSNLPEGDFGITEYVWPDKVLWFLDRDEFNADERQSAYLEFMLKGNERR
jgi:hypothetical protein